MSARPEERFLRKLAARQRKRNKKIIEVVQKYGYTQRQIAAQIQMHYSTISNLVRGKV